ncbi:MAG: hypothetical protein HOG79_14115 [Prolixibacteraceae bacterium]|jgi:hypothetical protein|nr:hypothetical protein [Prolixibacteraceae bacterium]MBT6766794.1 hypothetical protein [Prolixibacteraceae bacterium]
MNQRIKIGPIILSIICFITYIDKANCQPNNVETSSFLIKDRNEMPGCRLYSYVLFSNLPDSKSHTKYYELIKEVLIKFPYQKKSLINRNTEQTNKIYFPITASQIPENLSVGEIASYILEYYNYKKANEFLKKSGLEKPNSFYIVSYRDPLSKQPRPKDVALR